MAANPCDTEDLLRRIKQDDDSALGRLLVRHRNRLRGYVAARMDRRVAGRVDPSDVVQETLAEAGRNVGAFLRDRPLPFGSWLHKLAFQRLIWCHRFHVGSRKRSVRREAPAPAHDLRGQRLVDRLAGETTGASGHLVRSEERARVRATLATLAEIDRDVLELRYLDDLSFDEIAGRLGLGAGAVRMRHLRALERFHHAYDAPSDGTTG